MGKIFKSIDWLIFVPSLFLGGFSLALLSTISKDLLLSQFIFFIFGLFFFFVFSKIDWKIYKNLAAFIYLLSIFFLILTLLGPQVRGASRWVEVWKIRWQPSELVKPLLAISLASFFSSYPPKNPRILILGLAILAPPLFLIFRQPDLGNAVVIVGIWLGIVYGAGLPFFLGAVGAIFSFLLFPLGWFLLKGYQKARLISFLNPYLDPQGSGYNSIQAMIAVGSGQFLGRGLGQGPQSKLLFLPEHHTDFIFATLAEELGFMGAILAVLAYIVILYHILQVARNTRDSFGAFLLLGIFSQIFLQVFINVGMNLGLVPITGVTLPLLSYGGSSIVSTMISLGIVANIAKTTTKARAIDISF